LVLQVHRDPLEAVGELSGDGTTIDPADLLEIRELADLEAIEPNLPAEPPRAERWRLPIVFDEAHVVLFGLRPDGPRGLEVEVLDVEGRGFEDHLKLMKLL